MIRCPSDVLTLFDAVNRLISTIFIAGSAHRIVSEKNVLRVNRTMASQAPGVQTQKPQSMVLPMTLINSICKRDPTPVADVSEQRCLQEVNFPLVGALGVPRRRSQYSPNAWFCW